MLAAVGIAEVAAAVADIVEEIAAVAVVDIVVVVAVGIAVVVVGIVHGSVDVVLARERLSQEWAVPIAIDLLLGSHNRDALTQDR